MNITKFGSIGFGRISNVRTLESDPSCYFCDVELYEVDGTKGVVEYVARANDIATGQWIYEQITNGNFDGQITHIPSNIHPTTGEPLPNLKAQEARIKRDQLLIATDWTQMPDVPQTTKDLWQAYRQALRDVPQQVGFPDNIVWPVSPQAQTSNP